MPPLVEPIEGPELDRLITALLNATRAVHQIVEAELAAGREGIEVIDGAAERLRSMLVVFDEHHSDEQLASITQFLAIATIMVAERGGFGGVFHPEGPVEPGPPRTVE